MRGLRFLAVALLASGLSACGQIRSWGSPTPPTVAGGAGAYARQDGRAVVQVAMLEAPRTAGVRYRDLGQGMSDALARMLLKRSDFDVWIDPRGSRRVETALRGAQLPVRDRGREDARPPVDYVVSGKITDFHHVTDRRRLLGTRHEAVVAIDFQIVETRSQRVVAADHVRGTASVGKESEELYEEVDFGSYAFWSTPLGKAASDALKSAADRIAGLVPIHAGQPTIASVLGREIRIIGGQRAGVSPGREFYIYHLHTEGARRAVIDTDLGRPVTVRIMSAERDASVGWLIGRPPRGVDLRGAVLSRRAPEESPEAHAAR
jgi:curli biogenesis system outer membrane secretion channel CsgG